MPCNTQTFRLESVNIYFGRRHKSCYTLDGVTAVSLSDKYIEFSDQNTEYYLWFNLDAAGTDPVIAGKTAIEVVIATGDNFKTIGEKAVAEVKLLLNGVEPVFYSSYSDGCFCIEPFKIGAVLSASSAGDSGLTFEESVVGEEVQLGDLSEDPGLTIGEESTDITGHSGGSTPLDSIVTGLTADLEAQLFTLNSSVIGGIVGSAGRYTPSAAGSTELVGLGENRIGQSSRLTAGELRLVPTNITDGSRTMTIHNAVPTISGWNYSSTEKQSITINFKGLIKKGVNKAINLWSFGNPDQDLRQ